MKAITIVVAIFFIITSQNWSVACIKNLKFIRHNVEKISVEEQFIRRLKYLVFDLKILKLEDLERIQSSQSPLNPLGSVTGDLIRVTAQAKWFTEVLEQKSELKWEKIQQATNDFIKKLKEKSSIQQESREVTAEVFNPQVEMVINSFASIRYLPKVVKYQGEIRVVTLSMGINIEILNPFKNVHGVNRTTVPIGANIWGSVPVFFKQNNRLIGVVGTERGELQFFDYLDRRKLQNISLTDEMYNRFVRATPVIFKKDGKTYIVIGSSDGRIYVIDGFKREIIKKIKTEGRINSTVGIYNLKGKKYGIVGSDDGKIYIFDPLSGDVLRTITTEAAVKSTPAIFKKEGRLYGLVGSNDKKMYLIDLEATNNQPLKVINTDGQVRSRSNIFTKNGDSYIVVTTDNKKIHTISPFEGKIISTINAKDIADYTSATLFEKGGRAFGVYGGERGVTFFDPLEGQILKVIKTEFGVTSEIATFDHNGRSYVIGGTVGSKLYLIDVYGHLKNDTARKWF